MPGEGFSEEQLRQLRQIVGEQIREGFADAGQRVDGEHQDEAREDYRFLRRLRKGVDGTAAKIGWLVIAAIVAGALWLFNLGISTWRGL